MKISTGLLSASMQWIVSGAVLLLLGAPICARASICEWNLSIPKVKNTVEERSEWLYRTFTNQVPHLGRAESLAKIILARSPSEKAKWIQAMAKSYPRVSAGLMGPPPPHSVVGAKRVLDRLLFWTQELDLRFNNLSSTSGPRAALIEILSEQTKLFGTLCSEADVMLVADRFQAIIQEKARAHPKAAPIQIVIGGSFINGKWRPGSDVDLSISNPAALRELLPLLVEAVSSGLSPGCAPHISTSIEPAIFYGGINPFALEIRPEGLQLYVFSPKISGNARRPELSAFQIYRL